MKVKCISRDKINEVGRYLGLGINKEYIVLSIEFYNMDSTFSKHIGDSILYRLIDDDGVVIPYPSKLFEVITDEISISWVYYKNDDSYCLIPNRWARKYFWDDYYNDVEDALDDFKVMKEKIYYEEYGKLSLQNMKYSTWIELEECMEGTWNIFDDNTDVIVTFDDTTSWVASFYSYNNINKLAEKNKFTGENLGGKYLWGTDMILVDEISRERIEEVVKDLLIENEFKQAFAKCETISLE